MTDEITTLMAGRVIAKLASDLEVSPEDFLAALRTVIAASASTDGPIGKAMSVKEVAVRVDRDHQAVRRAIERGDLVAYKVGGRLNIYESDFKTWHDAARVSPGALTRATGLGADSRRAPTNGLVQLLESPGKAT